MNNPLSWDQVETLTEGLVVIAGWNSGENEIGLTAELLIVEEQEHEITFVVSETPEFLELVTRLVINFGRVIDEKRFEASLRLLHQIFIEESMPQHLKLAACDSREVVYEFVYAWKCDSELQQGITLAVLHDTVTRWSGPMSMPALSLAPLLGLYLRGMYRRDVDFVTGAKRSLGMIALSPKGHA